MLILFCSVVCRWLASRALMLAPTYFTWGSAYHRSHKRKMRYETTTPSMRSIAKQPNCYGPTIQSYAPSKVTTIPIRRTFWMSYRYQSKRAQLLHSQSWKDGKTHIHAQTHIQIRKYFNSATLCVVERCVPLRVCDAHVCWKCFMLESNANAVSFCFVVSPHLSLEIVIRTR